MKTTITRLISQHRAEWEPLARGYKAFYNTQTSDDEYSAAWNRLMVGRPVAGLAAFSDGQLVGIAHYLFHASTWTDGACYLQDLYTVPSARGQGIGRMLIEGVARVAKDAGATRLYWLTHEGNAAARLLYNRLASYAGFIRYDYPLVPPNN
jgi:GNAT superfamily N-acetyltransferase